MRLELDQNQIEGAFHSQADAQAWIEYQAVKIQARAARNFGIQVQTLYQIQELDGIGKGLYQVNYRIVKSN